MYEQSEQRRMGLRNADSSREHDDAPLVLIVDDDMDFVRYATVVVQAGGYRTTSAADGQTGLAIAEKYRPNVILLDVNIPDMDGFRICEEIKAQLSTSDIPIIFVTGEDRSDELTARCFATGGQDVIAKPVNRVDLLARLRVVLREQALREAYRKLALEDPFTTLANRRQLFMQITEAVNSSRRSNRESILLIADIDQLMSANEKHGYDLGDEMLLTFARLMKRLTGPDCRAGRLGGDELAMVLKNSSRQAGVAIAARLRQTFASIAFDAATSPKHFTACFGIASFRGEPADFDGDEFLRQADIALYAAKQLGRNRTVAYWDLDPNNLPEIAPGKRHARARGRRRTQRAYVGIPPEEILASNSQPAPSPQVAAQVTSDE